MRPKLNDKKGTHQFHTIQFSNKAIINLKWNKQTEKRQRIKIRLKNGPRGISMRWTPITNKKVFQLIFIYNGKKYTHDCGVFTPGVYTCNSLMDYMVKLNEKHLDTEGNYKTNPNVDVITKKQLKNSQLKTCRECIELICKDNYPRKNIKGNCQHCHKRTTPGFLLGYNKRRDHITFIDNNKGWGEAIFKDKSVNKRLGYIIQNIS